MRLDKFLTEKHPDLSRMKIQQLIKAGAVKVNGRVVSKPAYKLLKSDTVEAVDAKFLSLSKDDITIKPQPKIPLEIIYEDNDIVVINKQPGLITHPTLAQTTDTLVNALIARYPEIIQVGEDRLRPGIVHRLDKDTSGLIVVAKNQKAFDVLKKQFLDRSITKKYLALVEGVPKKFGGLIEYDIRPSKQNRLKKSRRKRNAQPGRRSDLPKIEIRPIGSHRIQSFKNLFTKN
jgi:23S rRNA pseudouridine1911/1915/1917 synthase